MSSAVVGAVVGGAVCLAVAPYLARLTLSAPDREDARWWTGRPASARRTALCALAAAVLGVLGGAAAGWSALLPAFVALALVCAPLVIIDYEIHRLPNRLVFVAVAAEIALGVLAAAVRSDWSQLLRGVGGAAAVFAALFALWTAAPRSFGYGDVKLGGVLGGYLGWFGWLFVFYGVFAGFLLGSVVALAMLVTGRASMKTAVAFGPMLILGPFLVLAFDLVPSTG
jgi:leader peptidase (prepilin peptidase)/N-methyltransferase